MNTQLIWFAILTLGLVQGIFLISALLFLKDRQVNSRVFLILTILCFLSLITSEWLKLQYPIEKMLFNYRTGETIPLLIGPIFLLYTYTLIHEYFRLEKKHLLHFLPFLFFLIWFLPFYFESNDVKLSEIAWLNENTAPPFMTGFSIFKGLHSLVYFAICWSVVHKYRKEGKKKAKQRFDPDLLIKLIALQIIGIVLIYSLVGLEYIFHGLDPDRISSAILTGTFFLFTLIILLYPKSLIPEKRSVILARRYRSSALGAGKKEFILRKVKELLENSIQQDFFQVSRQCFC